MMMMRLVALACLLACSALATVAHGARLPHTVTITSDDSVLVGADAPYGGDIDNATAHQHNALLLDTLPFSCQQQGCGPDVACGGGGGSGFGKAADANCYLYQGMFLCCTVSPLG